MYVRYLNMWPTLCLLLFATSGGVQITPVYDTSGLEIEEIMLKAGENISIPCPGLTDRSLVVDLLWVFLKKNLPLVQYSNEVTTMLINSTSISLTRQLCGLTFEPVYAEDSGDYVCLINNRPQPDGLIRLLVQDVPDPPGRPLIMSFTSRSVNLSWAPSQDTHHSAITHYIVHISVGEVGQWSTGHGVLTPDNRTNFQVTMLHPYTVYSFKIQAVNELGASLPGKESYYMVTLRELPTGKPVITTAHNVSSSAIHISWRPPTPETIHGEFLGYRITFRPRDRSHGMRETYIRDPAIESHTIHHLETYTQYLVSLQVFNPEGPGPTTTVLVMTDEGALSNDTVRSAGGNRGNDITEL